MKKLLIFIFSILLFSCKKPISRLSSSDQIDDNTLSKIENLFLSVPEETQISIAFIKEDTQYYYGLEKIDNQLIEQNTETSIFEIASLTKLFTAEALLIAEQNNKLTSEKTIFECLSNFPELDSISLLQLVNHTSGFTPIKENKLLEKWKPKHALLSMDVNGIEKYLQSQKNINNLYYRYSNESFGILGYILEKTYNKELESIFNEFYYKPLRLSQTSFNDQNNTVIPLNTYGFKTDNWQFKAMKGCGGLKSSTSDLTKFIQQKFKLSNINNKLFNPTFSSQNASVSYGWHIYNNNNKTYYEHGGLSKGYSNYIALNKEKKSSVIILSNLSGFGPFMSKIQPLTRELLYSFENK